MEGRTHRNVRRLSVKLLKMYMKRALSLTLGKWRIVTVSQRHTAPSQATLNRTRSFAVILNKSGKKNVGKTQIGAKIGLKSNGNSPNVKNLTIGVENGGWKGKKEGETQATSPRMLKRPTSVPPTESPSAKQITPFQIGASPQPRSTKATVDVGTRLYQKAQEIEDRLEAMRKSMEPGYTFTPSLARNTEKWLNHKSAKSTPVKQRAEWEEDVAVVSSAAAVSALSRIGETKGGRKVTGERVTVNVREVYPTSTPHSVLIDFTDAQS